MADTQKPAWGSYADLKKIQREREQAQKAQAPPAVVPAVEPPASPIETPIAEVTPPSPPGLKTGHPQVSHPDSGHPRNEHPESGRPQFGHPDNEHPQTGPPESGHPESGHPEVQDSGTQVVGTQSPIERAPGHPTESIEAPSLRVPAKQKSGHPPSPKPGTQSIKTPRSVPDALSDTEPRESPYWPSRKYKTRLNLRFPGDLAQELERYCQRYGLSKQDATEIAIRRLISDDRTLSRAPGLPQTGHPLNGHPSTWVPERTHDHDDEDDERIIIYQQLTGNRVNARDRAALDEVRHLHTDIIREGVRLSLERAPAPVKSFRYCLGAILEVAARTGAAPLPRKPVAVPPPTSPRSTEETILLARALIRQIRLDTPGISESDLESSLLAWASEQGVENAATVVDAALAAENG